MPKNKESMKNITILMMWEQEYKGDWCFGCFPVHLTDWLAAWLIGWFAVLCLSSGAAPAFESRGKMKRQCQAAF